jgi:Uma2 family endonuclease
VAAQPEIAPSPPVVFRPVHEDQVVVLYRIPWEQYDGLCIARENTAGPRMAYLKGTLEIMSPSPRHEYEKKLIARLLETYAEETGLSLNGFGSTTYRRKVKEAGLEPDECYCLGEAKKFPDLAIEVSHTSSGIDKLEIYRRLAVAEVWFWAKGRLWLYVLAGARYEAREQSQVLPRLDVAELSRIVGGTDESHQTEAVRAYRRAIRDSRRRAPAARAPAVTKRAARAPGARVKAK